MENEYQTPQEEIQEATQENCAPETAEAPQSPKKRFPIKAVIIAAAVVITALVALLVFSMVTNTYKTPIKLMAKLEDNKAGNVVNETLDQLNGFTEKETRAILKIMKKSDDFKDELEDGQEAFEEGIEEMQEMYGKNYKVKYEITDKEKIDKDDLEDIKDGFEEMAEGIEDLVDETKDLDSDEWEEMADESGLSKTELKKLFKAYGKLGKAYKKARITAGYELEVKWTIECGKDAEADEDLEWEDTVYVYKINGRWVCLDAMDLDILGGLF